MKNNFKMLVCIMLNLFLVISAISCKSNNDGKNPTPSDYNRPLNPTIDTNFKASSNVLVAYFSKTNTTTTVAKVIAEYTNADLFEIERKEPYPEDYEPTTEEAQKEKEANFRPELARYLTDEVMVDYDTIFLGFPIWWHTAPMPVLSFLNYYDLSKKTIYTFATSGGSPISESTADIRSNTKATVNEGRRFSRNDNTAIQSWIDSLSLNIEQPEPNDFAHTDEEMAEIAKVNKNKRYYEMSLKQATKTYLNIRPDFNEQE